MQVLPRIFALFLVCSSLCQAVLVNRTIDDSDIGDPTTGFIPIFQPQIWNRNKQPCTGCTITPDPSLAFDGTMSSTTYLPDKFQNINFTLKFTGTAIWVFFILANANKNNPFTGTHCNFTLDGKHAGTFSHNPDMSTTALQYNATVFSQTGLSNTPHELVVSVNDYPNITFICFDWAMYTFDNQSSSSSSSSSKSSSTLALPTGSTHASATTSTTPTNVSTTTSTAATTTNSSSAKRPQARTGVIVGSVIGALALVVTALCI